MKTWSKVIPVFLGMWGWVLATAPGSAAAPTVDAGAIQAIQQAPDPSAAVGAFANGFVVDRNNPKLYEAYVARMVDLGLPELAYHQAEVLSTLEPTNGLAWGVVGYVNARRGDMPNAISAIVLAGQAAPDSLLVQRTAGEIVAWYDLKADKSQIPDNAKNGLATIRGRFGTSPAFTQAYDTARQAYVTQTKADQPSTQAAPRQPENAAQPYSTASSDYGQASPVYYNNYYYDWGPSWIEPAPWWWWQPAGFFVGFDFCPFPAVFVFDRHEFFEHHHRFFHDDRFFHHDGDDRIVWHRDASGRANFFGTPARPNVALDPRATSVAGVTPPNSGMRVSPMSPGRPAPAAPVVAPPIMIRRTDSAVAPPPMARPMPPAGAAGQSHQAFASGARPSGGGGMHHGTR